MQLYGRPEGRRAVEVGDGLCPHCEFVIEHCAEREPGAVFFVHRAGEPTRSLRRVKVIWQSGDRGGMVCQATSVDAMNNELRNVS